MERVSGDNTSIQQNQIQTTQETTKSESTNRSSPLGFGETKDTTAPSGEKAAAKDLKAHTPDLEKTDAQPVTNPDDVLSDKIADDQLALEHEGHVEDFLNKMVANGRITEQQARELFFKYSVGAQDEINDPALAEVLAEAQESANGEVRKQNKLADDAPIPNRQERYKAGAQAAKRDAVLNQIRSNPENVDENGNLNQKGKTLRHQIFTGNYEAGSEADNIVKAADVAIQERIGATGIEINIGNYEGKIVNEYETSVESAIDALNIPEDRKNLLKGLFYYPDDVNYPDAMAELNEITAGVRTGLETGYGFDPNYEIKSDSFLYDARVNGTYYQALDKAIQAQTPPLTDAEVAMINAFLKGEAPGDMPQSLKDIATKLDQAALDVVKKTLNPPSGWQVDRSQSLATYNREPFSALINQGDDLLASMEQTIEGLFADGLITEDQRVILLEVMKQISAVLNELTLYLYEMAAVDAEVGKKISEARRGSVNDAFAKTKQLSDIRKEKMEAHKEEVRKAEEEQRKAQEEAEEKQSVISVITDVVMFGGLGFVGAAILVIKYTQDTDLAPVMKPLAFIPAAITTVTSKVSEGIGKVAEKIGEGIDVMMEAWADAFLEAGWIDEAQAEQMKVIGGLVLKATFIAVLAITATILSAGNVTVGFMVAGAFLMESGWFETSVQDVAVTFPGGKEWLQENAELAFALQIAVFVVMLAFTFLGAKGGNVGKLATAGEKVGKVGRAAGRAGARVARGIGRQAGRAGSAVGSAARSVGSSARSAASASRSRLASSRLGKQLASASEKASAVLDDLLQWVKKLISALKSLGNNPVGQGVASAGRAVGQGASAVGRGVSKGLNKAGTVAMNHQGLISKALDGIMMLGFSVTQGMTGASNVKLGDAEKALEKIKEELADILELIGKLEHGIEILMTVGDAFEQFTETLANESSQMMEFKEAVEATQINKYKVSDATSEGWQAVKDS